VTTGILMWMGRATAAAAVLMWAGCVSTPVPNEKIALAKSSVQRAEQAGATEFAPVELAAAREKLSSAEQAASHRDTQPASDLAEQADVDAQLAEATAMQQKAHKAAAEFDVSLQTLRQESTRSSQPPQ